MACCMLSALTKRMSAKPRDLPYMFVRMLQLSGDVSRNISISCSSFTFQAMLPMYMFRLGSPALSGPAGASNWERSKRRCGTRLSSSRDPRTAIACRAVSAVLKYINLGVYAINSADMINKIILNYVTKVMETTTEKKNLLIIYTPILLISSCLRGVSPHSLWTHQFWPQQRTLANLPRWSPKLNFQRKRLLIFLYLLKLIFC